MKKIFLFSTKLVYFWTVLPLVALLVLSISLNNKVDTIFRLYPLILALTAGIIFIIIYFFRGVILHYDFAKCIGVFSSKEYTGFETGYYILLTQIKKHRVLVEVFGQVSSEKIGYSWYDDSRREYINLLRAKANGSEKTIKRIVYYYGSYYGIDAVEINTALLDRNHSAESDEMIIQTYTTEEDNLNHVKISFKYIPVAEQTDPV